MYFGSHYFPVDFARILLTHDLVRVHSRIFCGHVNGLRLLCLICIIFCSNNEVHYFITIKPRLSTSIEQWLIMPSSAAAAAAAAVVSLIK